MNDMPRRQPIPPSNLRLPHLAAAQKPALRYQFRPRGAVDGTVDSSAAQEGGVRGVDDGVYGEGGDVGLEGSEEGGGLRHTGRIAAFQEWHSEKAVSKPSRSQRRRRVTVLNEGRSK